ncbi:Eukaryotic translation initiation factor 3 subunit 8 N-terminus, putative [Angomonas deanei]|uniref:Eukaryotic translation initiation factor 3 subunit 8 N-terminus, putative n=1 Tax=Angomonas deanei TaxID=59799 RepID=A0A7G2C3P3_9TRYP|nr:Eukaryotic translation initiation factor 3 subunit 8 N-terminus, putative [Angomonas deanei]
MYQFNQFDSSSSDGSHSSDTASQSGEEDEYKIADYWFQVTDDEKEDDQRAELISSQEKARRTLSSICSVFDHMMNADVKDFKRCSEVFDDMVEEFVSFYKKYSTIPDCVFDTLENIPEMEELLSTFKPSDDEEEEGATKEERRNYKFLTTLATKYTAFAEDVEEKKQALEAGDAEEKDEEEGDADEKALTEEEYIALLSSFDSKKYNAAKIARVCKQNGYLSCYVSASALSASIRVEQSRVKPTLLSLNQALTALLSSFDALRENAELQYNERPDQLDTKTAFIPGGYHSILLNLNENLLHLTQTLTAGVKTGYDDSQLRQTVEMENTIVDVADTLAGFYQKQKVKAPALDCCQILLDILARRREDAHAILFGLMTRKSGVIVEKSLAATIQKLSTVFAASKNEVYKYKALTAIAYQQALQGKYRQARDFLLRSKIPTFVEENQHEISLSVFYNSTVIQIALAAFAAGDMAETNKLMRAFFSLESDQATLIGQFRATQGEVEKVRKYFNLSYTAVLTLSDNTVPFHTQIPYAQIEAVAMLSALITDTLNEVKNPFEYVNRTDIFKKALNFGNRITSSNTRHYSTPLQDSTSIAYHALRVGDYATAAAAVSSLAVWRSIANGANILAKYLEVLKETAVATFCLSSPGKYASLSVVQLAMKYELDETKVRYIINRVLSEEKSLVAYWDAEDKFLFIDPNNTTRLQHHVLGTADFISALSTQSIARASAHKY